MIDEIIKSPKVSFCCGALEYFQNEVVISGYTVEMVLMIKGAHSDVTYPKVDSWEMEEAIKEIAENCMDKMIVPKNMEQIKVKKQNGIIKIEADKISLNIPENRVAFLDCENFMMDEVAVSFLNSISGKFPNKKIGMRISFGEPVGEAEVWL
ncbi:MAG: hypothetical protein WA139_04890 [Candidatus Aenigmatarchaeota archaeon]